MCCLNTVPLLVEDTPPLLCGGAVEGIHSIPPLRPHVNVLLHADNVNQ